MKITQLAKSHFLCGICIWQTVETQIKGHIPSGVSECLCFTPHQQPRTGISLGSTFVLR